MNKILLLPFIFLLGATVTVLPSSSVTNTYTTGSITDVDEGTASPNDSDFMTADDSGYSFEYTPTAHGLTDADTITNVTINIRVKDNDNSSRWDVYLYIGGVSKGSVTYNSNTVITTAAINTAGWNTDWTEAQLDTIKVRIDTADAGTVDTFWLYATDVVITYTAGAGGATNVVRMIL